MSNRTLYYPSTDDTSIIYQAEDYRIPWANLMSNGVVKGYDVTVNNPANLSVNVAPGVAVINGHISIDDATVNLSISANTSGFFRYDRIVLDIDDLNSKTTIKVLQGVPSSDGNIPDVSSNQISLATIRIDNNVSTIERYMIHDTRKFISYVPLSDGWTPIPYPCTAINATTFTIPSQINDFFSIGDKIRCPAPPSPVEGAPDYHYFYVTNVLANFEVTTITVTGEYRCPTGSTDTICYSKAETPSGFPDWLSWSPTFSSTLGTPYAPEYIQYSIYKIDGRDCRIALWATGTISANAGVIQVSSPVSARDGYEYAITGFVQDGSGQPIVPANAYIHDNIISVVPYNGNAFGTGDGRVININGSYPIGLF